MMTITKKCCMKTPTIFRVKRIYHEFSAFKAATEESLGRLKLRNVNRLIFVQININSIRNNFELLFSLLANNIDVLLISETKIDNAFPASQFSVPGYSIP